MKEQIREVLPEDASDIQQIYNYYIEESVATFETTPLTEEEMRLRIAAVSLHFPYFVYATPEGIGGYCYAHTWKNRAAYDATVETTVYLHPDCVGRGVGRALMEVLLGSLKARGFHVAIACISYPNEPSIRLHEQLGFYNVAHYDEVGCKFDRLLDVGEWQIIL